MKRGRGRTIWYEMWPLIALCVLIASRWLLEGAFPETASSFWSEGLGCGMAGGCAGAVAVFWSGRRGSPARGVRRGVWSVVGGAVVLSGPALAQLLAGRRISPEYATLALALVPIVVAVGVSGGGNSEGGDLPGMLWPGLAGLAGLLLLLPQPAFSEWRPWVGLCFMPVLVGVGAWLFWADGAGSSSDVASERNLDTTWALLVGAVIFCSVGGWAGGGGGGWHWSAGASGLDGLAALLGLVALRRLGPVRWSAQFLLVPLLSLGEGFFFLRPILDARSWVGVGLVGLGAGYQLMSSRGASNTVTHGGVPIR